MKKKRNYKLEKAVGEWIYNNTNPKDGYRFVTTEFFKTFKLSGIKLDYQNIQQRDAIYRALQGMRDSFGTTYVLAVQNNLLHGINYFNDYPKFKKDMNENEKIFWMWKKTFTTDGRKVHGFYQPTERERLEIEQNQRLRNPDVNKLHRIQEQKKFNMPITPPIIDGFSTIKIQNAYEELLKKIEAKAKKGKKTILKYQ